MASIRERTSRAGEHTWSVLFRHGSRHTSLTFETPKAAERFKGVVDLLGPDRAIESLRTNTPDDRLTVDELATRFLEWKTRDVTARRMTDCRRDYANWIKPWFGHRAAESIDETDVQSVVDHMAGRLSPKPVVDRHMLLHSIVIRVVSRAR